MMNNIEYEGLYIFGGMSNDGAATDELYIIQLGKDKIGVIEGKKVCKGKPPLARFDHTVERIK
jgi:hypothetical protein